MKNTLPPKNLPEDSLNDRPKFFKDLINRRLNFLLHEGPSTFRSQENLVLDTGEERFESKINFFQANENSHSEFVNFRTNYPHYKKKSPKRKSVFSKDEKNRIVLDCLNGSLTIEELCKEESISHIQLNEWINEFTGMKESGFITENSDVQLDTVARKKILKNLHEEGFKFFLKHLNVAKETTIVKEDLDYLAWNKSSLDVRNIFSLARVNDIRRINKYFEGVNEFLPQNGLFCGYSETIFGRKKRLKIYSVPVLGFIYSGFEFIWRRVFPKIPLIQNLYFSLSKGKNRLISKAEVLGRLVSCGFKIVDFKSIDGIVYFVAKKVDEPAFNMNPSYGPIYAMPRVGKKGKIIKVYKFRTMHPYSEYLQDFMVDRFGYNSVGKPANDFRIPKWGKILRRYWLDELPQLFNVLKGDMKLVGVRPLSHFRFNEIPTEMQKLRLPQKPGCFPPYVALCMPNQIENLQAEVIYLKEKTKRPYTTDTKYFFKSIYNILTNKIRSS
jgi:lipopolysaccharide/colanic/teichoic acid biosynthesis glycosyltransferase/transposase-like protein